MSVPFNGGYLILNQNETCEFYVGSTFSAKEGQEIRYVSPNDLMSALLRYYADRESPKIVGKEISSRVESMYLEDEIGEAVLTCFKNYNFYTTNASFDSVTNFINDLYPLLPSTYLPSQGEVHTKIAKYITYGSMLSEQRFSFVKCLMDLHKEALHDPNATAKRAS